MIFKFLKRYWQLLCIYIISFVIFFPSLSMFYTNDDFFFLYISNVKNLSGFLNFFNLLHGPGGFGMYRPLTTQVFYFLGEKIFNFQPLYLHIISFMVFFGVIYLVYQLALYLFNTVKSKSSNLAALAVTFLYAVSAIHFGHLYYLATFQELGMTFFVLLTCLMFIKKKYFPAFVFFLFALMSKETAVVTPVLLILIYFFEKYAGRKVVSLKRLLILVLPYLLTLAVYLLLRFRFYGFATGDSYVWNFSVKKFVNTIMWYFLWSFNIPESVVDFIGPGLQVNPNLFKYWSAEMIPIFILFILQCLILIWMYIKLILAKAGEKIRKMDTVSIFCIVWFAVTILPVAFLPLHKFTFYLTLPLIGIAVRIGYLFTQSKIGKIVPFVFLALWTATSILTVNYSKSTSWITQGEEVSKRAFDYFAANDKNIGNKNIYFTDILGDLNLPWSPTSVLRTVLSDQNFFKVFYPNMAGRVSYLSSGKVAQGSYLVKSRDLLGY